MKTTVQKTMVAIIVALFSLSVNAQNTKDINYAFYNASEFVTSHVEDAASELEMYLNTLKSVVKFKPENDPATGNSETMVANFYEIENQLEDAARFIPSVDTEIYSDEDLNNSNLDQILDELQQVTRFKPALDIENEFTEVLKKLSESAKFSPSANL